MTLPRTQEAQRHESGPGASQACHIHRAFLPLRGMLAPWRVVAIQHMALEEKTLASSLLTGLACRGLGTLPKPCPSQSAWQASVAGTAGAAPHAPRVWTRGEGQRPTGPKLQRPQNEQRPKKQVTDEGTHPVLPSALQRWRWGRPLPLLNEARRHQGTILNNATAEHRPTKSTNLRTTIGNRAAPLPPQNEMHCKQCLPA